MLSIAQQAHHIFCVESIHKAHQSKYHKGSTVEEVSSHRDGTDTSTKPSAITAHSCELVATYQSSSNRSIRRLSQRSHNPRSFVLAHDGEVDRGVHDREQQNGYCDHPAISLRYVRYAIVVRATHAPSKIRKSVSFCINELPQPSAISGILGVSVGSSLNEPQGYCLNASVADYLGQSPHPSRGSFEPRIVRAAG